MRIEMKLIQSALIVASLLGLNASAQPTPPTPTNLPPPPLPPNNRPAFTLPATNRPGTPPLNNRPSPQMPPGLMRGPTTPPPPPPPMPEKDKLSDAIGVYFGNMIKRDHLDLDMDATIKAMKEAAAGQPTRMTDKEVQEVLKQLSKALPAKMAAENKAKGDEFMAKNAKDPAFKTLPNGIQYKVLKEGAGPMPKPTDTVVVAYQGRLVDGTVFDQKDLFTNQVSGRIIKGWTEVLPLMKTGSKWDIVVPADLAYGTRGFPPKIGPNSVLDFDIELLAITVPPPPPAKSLTQPAQFHPTSLTAPTTFTNSGSTTNTTTVSGPIIKVPSAEEMKKGAKIEVITNAPNP